jgi:F0F1-type ATP synthase membrane subunit b/b'
MRLLAVLLIIINNATASEVNTHHGLESLIYPTINFCLFAALLVYKVYPLLKQNFREQHLLIKNQFVMASEKLTHALAANKDLNYKLATINQKEETLRSASLRDLNIFSVRYAKEKEEKLSQLKVEVAHRKEFEQVAMMDRLYGHVLKKLIQETFKEISSNKTTMQKIASSLLKKVS